jgi:hypothetical protein
MAYNPDQPRVPAGKTEGGRWTSDKTVSAAREAAGLGRKYRVLPGTKCGKLSEGTSFYHVTSMKNKDSVLKHGLRKSSEVSEYSMDSLVKWEQDHPVDGVFLTNWEQAEVLADQLANYGEVPLILDVYLKKNTMVYFDPLMFAETSFQVEGSISPRAIRALPSGYIPFDKGKLSTERILKIKWKELPNGL